jgi:diguanylate cyclase (GGDEF)-like protein/PAS domain S-box-containing protein
MGVFMPTRLRDRVNEEREANTEQVGLREILGLPSGSSEAKTETSHLITLTLLGMRWMAAGNILCGLVIAATIYLSSAPFLSTPFAAPLISLAAILILCDIFAFIPSFEARLMRLRPGIAITLVCLLNAVTAGCWAILLEESLGAPWPLAVIAASALGLGKLATMAMPIVFGVRVFVAIAVYLLAGKALVPAAAMIITVVLSIALVMSISAKRWAFLLEKNHSDSNARVAGDLINAFEQSGRGWFWGTDREGHLIYVSPRLAEQLGATPEQLDGASFASLFVTDRSASFADGQIERTIGFTLTAGLEFHDLVVRPAGANERWWSLSGTPNLDEKGRCIGFLGSGTDLTAQRLSEANATKLALYDSLTGLPNRVLMRQSLDELLSNSRRQRNCGLFLLDLDRFKNVNDTLGHPVGDALLQIVAQRLARVVGSRGQVGRLGGDEFKVVIANAKDRADLAELAELIIARLSLPYVIGDSTVQIGATIGISVAPTDGVDPDELTRNADLALYAAKAAGKGVHRFYQPEMHAEADYRRALENDLRELALEKELSVVYQPIVDAKTEEVTGFEALVRWEHPSKGFISPSIFIPIAEEIGLIGRIGDWVIRTACEQAVKWPEHLRIAVNLSPLQFASASLPSTLMRALAESGLEPSRLELEVTEGVLLDDNATTQRMFKTITGMGMRIVLDDFGTGYASLSYLKQLPFSKIKIDQSFVRGAVAEEGRNSAIIVAIVGLAEKLGMETVAEGAETLGEIELIRSLGCSQIQGYIFGEPLSADEAFARANKAQNPDDLIAKLQSTREPRTSILRFATMNSGGHVHAVRIRNISPNGALIEAHAEAALGPRVELTCGTSYILSGEVRWRKENRIGIRFDTPIDVGDFVQATASKVARTRLENGDFGESQAA